MKNIFSFNIEENANRPSSSELLKEFVLREIDEDLSQNQEKITDKMEELEKRWSLPIWLTILRLVMVCLGAMDLCCLIMLLMSRGIGVFFNPLYSVFLALGILLVAGGFIFFAVESSRKKRVEASPEYLEGIEYIKSLTKSSEEYLQLPEEKTKVDIFYYPYIMRDGKKRDSGAFKYLCQSLYLFVEDGKLCLADSGAVFGIDLKLFRRMIIDPKKTSFAPWQKDVSFNKEPYKDYKISLDNYGIYHVRNACSVQFTKDEERHELIIPPYEIKHFEAILNLKAKEAEED